MPIKEAMVLYISVAGLIYLVFERVEKLSSKSDLELYYLLMTIKRENIASVWHNGILRFFDSVFGRGVRAGTLTLPRFSRVILFTALIHCLSYVFIIRNMNVSAYGRASFLPVLTPAMDKG
jgi:hypothetical protein